jgi:sugar O-acyltransferase (sialic acid O-acetyltransferase NeuD family)
MTRPLVIFGLTEAAELAHWYFTRDMGRDVVAFAVDAAWLPDAPFCGRPVVAFETLAESHPPQTHDVFIALGYSKLNAVRRDKFVAARALGYSLPSYVSPRASVLNDGAIGQNCFILEDNTIQPFVRIGDNVTLWSGNHIGHHSVIEDHVFVASHVVVSGKCRVGEASFLGVNATLRDGLTIGPRCVIGAGALLLADAEAEGVYMGGASERARVPSSRLRGI